MGGRECPQAIIDAVLKVKPKLKIQNLFYLGRREINQLIPDDKRKN